jgi:hypothetical protein
MGSTYAENNQMLAPKTPFRALVALVALLAMVGCTTVQPLAVNPSGLSQSLQRGDQVDIVTANGQEMRITIDSVDANGLQGSGQRVSFSDIRSINRRQISVGRTALIVLGVLAVGAAAAGGGGGGGSSY